MQILLISKIIMQFVLFLHNNTKYIVPVLELLLVVVVVVVGVVLKKKLTDIFQIFQIIS